MSDNEINDQNNDQTTELTSEMVFSDDFKKAVRDYCNKDDQCIALNKQLKLLKSEIKDLEEVIIKHMVDHKLPLFDTKDKGLFKSTTKKETKGLSKELIVNALSKCGQLKDPGKVNEVVQYIYDSRPSEQKTVLVRKV